MHKKILRYILGYCISKLYSQVTVNGLFFNFLITPSYVYDLNADKVCPDQFSYLEGAKRTSVSGNCFKAVFKPLNETIGWIR